MVVLLKSVPNLYSAHKIQPVSIVVEMAEQALFVALFPI